MSLLHTVSLEEIEQVVFAKCNFKGQEYDVNNGKNLNITCAKGSICQTCK